MIRSASVKYCLALITSGFVDVSSAEREKDILNLEVSSCNKQTCEEESDLHNKLFLSTVLCWIIPTAG